MMFWLIPVAVTILFLSWFLIRILGQYERESTAAAFEKIEQIEEKLENVEERLITLEAIESEVILDSEKGKEMPDSAESLNSGRKPLIE